LNKYVNTLKGGDNKLIKAIDKMMSILSLYSMDRPSLSISEIQKETEYPKSTIFRILNTLEKRDYIKRNPDNHRYSLDFQFFRLGSIVQNELDFRQVALPIMEELSKSTNETVEINIIDDISRVCVEKIDSTQDVRNFVRVGERRPLYLGASGKVLLAFVNEKERERILTAISEQNSNIDVKKIKEQITSIKEKGYCVTRGERVTGSYAVSAPVFDHTGNMIASLTVAGPIQRLSEEYVQTLVNLLQQSTSKLNEQLGYFRSKVI